MTELAFALVAQGSLLALVLVAMESRYPAANRFLAGLLVALILPLLARVLEGRVGAGHRWIGLLNNAAFLIGPFFYFYTRALVDRTFTAHASQLLHLLPALATVAITLSIPGMDRLATETELGRTVAVFGLLNALSLIVYSCAVLRRLRVYRQMLLDNYSAIERIGLDWLKVLAVIVLTSGVAIAALNCLRLVHDLPPFTIALIMVPFSLVFFYTVAILGFRQSSVLLIRTSTEIPAPAEPQSAAESPAIATATEGQDDAGGGKYERSGLEEERARRIWSRLEQLMAAESLYLDPDLELGTLVERLDVNPQTLSEVLGRVAGSRFYDYINGLRVARAKEMLLDPAHARESVLDIALASGFNSKSTFNKYFKQVVGRTPSAYRQLSAAVAPSRPARSQN
jgi:AraC-like DNA-binding protein